MKSPVFPAGRGWGMLLCLSLLWPRSCCSQVYCSSGVFIRNGAKSAQVLAFPPLAQALGFGTLVCRNPLSPPSEGAWCCCTALCPSRLSAGLLQDNVWWDWNGAAGASSPGWAQAEAGGCSSAVGLWLRAAITLSSWSVVLLSDFPEPCWGKLNTRL